MLRRGLFPFIKKKLLLFLALIFITTIGVMFSTGFVSCYLDYKRESLAYINNYGLPDILLNSYNTFTDDTVADIKVEGCEIFYRFQGDAEITINDKIYNSKLTTFDKNSFSKRYVVKETSDSTDKTNINVDFVFASFNNIKPSDTGSIKLNNKSKNIFVNKIVGNPESISYSTGTVVPVDRHNYGCMYLDKTETSYFNISNNQIIVKIIDSTKTKDDINKTLISKLENKSIIVSSSVYKENNSSYKSIVNADRDLKKVAIIVPSVVIGLLLVLIFLFMYQVSKSLTREFGILIALGNSIKSVFLLLVGFAVVVSIVSSILGILCGHILSSSLYNGFKNSFYIPIGYGGVLFNISIYTFLASLLITFLAVLSTILVIRKISPLEAINNSKNEYKPLIKPIEKIVDKSGISTKIAVASVMKEKVRSFVSIIAIVISFSICFGSLNLYQSEAGLINQLYARYNYDAEVYIKDSSELSNVLNFVKEQKTNGLVSDYSQTKTAYLKINDIKDTFAFKGIKNNNNMNNVFDSNNQKINIKEGNYVVIDELFARENNFKKGDIVKINKANLTIQEICHNCSEKRNYINYDTLTDVIKPTNYFDTITIDTNDLNLFKKEISKHNYSVDVINIISLGQTITTGYQAIIGLSEGLVVLGILIGFATLTIMAVTSMNEQKRKFSIMRSLGLKISEVSRVIFIQNTIFVTIGLAIGIPCGMFFAKWMVDTCKTRWTALFNFNYWWLYLLVVGFMVLIMTLTHIISIIRIKHTNLVENTCSRE